MDRHHSPCATVGSPTTATSDSLAPRHQGMGSESLVDASRQSNPRDGYHTNSFLSASSPSPRFTGLVLSSPAQGCEAPVDITLNNPSSIASSSQDDQTPLVFRNPFADPLSPTGLPLIAESAQVSGQPQEQPTQDHPQHQHEHHHHPTQPISRFRPFIHAVMAFEKARKFSTGTSVHRKRQMSTLVEKEGHFGPALTVSAVPDSVFMWLIDANSHPFARLSILVFLPSSQMTILLSLLWLFTTPST